MRISHRVVFLVPSINTVVESDLRFLPPAVIGQVEQMPSEQRTGSSTTENSNRIDAMNARLPGVIRDLPLQTLDMVAYACTAGSFFSSWSSPQEFERHLLELAGRPTSSTAGAVSSLLREFPGRRVSLLSPYAPAVNAKMARVLEADGARIVQAATDPRFLEPGMPIGDESPDDIAAFVTGTAAPDAEILVLPCSGWRALEARASIEVSTGRPVITANQALFWAVLNRLGLDGSSFFPGHTAPAR